MEDFYGNPYEPARWTRFTMLSQILGFETRRTQAFEKWADNVVAEIKKLGYQPEVFKEITPNIGGNILFVHIQVPTIGKAEVVLTLNYYDTWTKQEVDPGKQVISNLQWYSQHPA